MQKTLKRYFPIFVLPTLCAFAFAFIIPFVMGVYLSFCKFKTITNAKFIGFDNYIKIFADKDFINAFLFTLKFSAVSIITVNLFAFVLALALCLCAGPTLKFTISGRIALQRKQEAEGVTPVLETEVGLADQDVEVAGVVETHLKVVILIELDSLSKGAMSSQSI